MLETCRTDLARLWGRPASDVIFVGSATEALALTLQGIFLDESQVVVTTGIEHAAVLSALKGVASRVITLAVNRSGVVDPAAVGPQLRALGSRLGMVVIMGANNETGAIQPVVEIARAARKVNPRVQVVSDLVALAPWVNLRTLLREIDFGVVAGHKLGGPVGCGVLVRRTVTALHSGLAGGGQEYGVRGGTVSVPLVAATVLALMTRDHEVAELANRVEVLRDQLEERILSELGDAVVVSGSVARVPSISDIAVPGLRAEDLVIMLDDAGVSVSPGAACASGAREDSHVLTAMGLESLGGAVRFSLGATTTAQEIDFAGAALVKAATTLRSRMVNR